jgi:exonuclease 1
MGIQGLLPLLKDIQVSSALSCSESSSFQQADSLTQQVVRHVSHYAGLTLGVDAYVWLHKGAYSCAQELVQGTETTK